MLKNFSKRYPLVVFFILMIVFITPLALAWTLINTQQNLHQRTTNHGKFIKPPLSLNKLSLKDSGGKQINTKYWRGKWVLLYVNSEVTCARDCEVQLLNMRQIRLATGKHMDHVLRVILTFDTGENLSKLSSMVRRRYTGTVIAHTAKKEFERFARHLDGMIYIADPRGNLMMSFDKNVPRLHVFKDLQHLLRVN